jgi:hypothetical protein
VVKEKSNSKYKPAELVADYKLLFESEAGERVLYDLMKKCHFIHTSYDGDVHSTVFREGERNVVNYILTMLKQDPVHIKKLIDKQEEEEFTYA